MKREWITDTSKMNFTEEELNIVNKVIDFTDTILYYNGKDYKTEDPSDTYYFTSKDLLMEDMNYNYTELEKEGVFEEEEVPADPWLKILEDRVDEWQKRFENQDVLLKRAFKHFKEWVNRFVEESSTYDIEIQLGTLKDMESAYKFAWERLGRAKDDLAAYKRTMKL